MQISLLSYLSKIAVQSAVSGQQTNQLWYDRDVLFQLVQRVTNSIPLATAPGSFDNHEQLVH